MSKTIKVLSIISVIMIALSIFLAIGFLTVLWEPMGILYSNRDYLKETSPVLPLGDAVYLLCSFAVVLSLLLTCNTKKNIAIEIITILCLLFVLPIARNFLSLQQSMLLSGFSGVKELSALTITKSIISFPMNLAEFASSLCLINVGMRIAEKVLLSKQIKN